VLVRATLVGTCGASARFCSQDMSTDHARQAYTSALFAISALAPSSTRLHLQTRATALLVPYLYRDLWPLLALTLHPLESHESAVVWAKLALCAVADVGVPLLQPCGDVAADPAVRCVRRPSCLI
jgi:hypothetical protein